MSLRNKVAIVTGGGRGIGRGIVDRFLAEGASVAVLQRSAPDADLLARPDVLHVGVDMADVSSLRAAVQAAVEAFGGIDVVVNNAGAMAECDLESLTPEAWDRMMAVNTRAPIFLIQAALPELRRRRGSIINIGSIEGLAANPLHAAYCASKAAVHGMTRALAVDLGEHGVRCNAIAPGWIVSELSESYLGDRADAAEARRQLVEMHPVGRLGEPADIGDAAVFLASDGAGFVTGQVLVVDGGRTAKLPAPAS